MAENIGKTALNEITKFLKSLHVDTETPRRTYTWMQDYYNKTNGFFTPFNKSDSVTGVLTTSLILTGLAVAFAAAAIVLTNLAMIALLGSLAVAGVATVGGDKKLADTALSVTAMSALAAIAFTSLSLIFEAVSALAIPLLLVAYPLSRAASTVMSAVADSLPSDTNDSVARP